MQCHGFIKDIYVGTAFKEQNLRFEKWQIDRPFLNLEFIWGDGEGFIMMCESQKEFHIQKKFHYQVLLDGEKNPLYNANGGQFSSAVDT